MLEWKAGLRRDERSQNRTAMAHGTLRSFSNKDGNFFAATRTRPQNATAPIRLSTVSSPLFGNPSHRSKLSYTGASSSRMTKQPNTLCVTRRLVIRSSV